MSSARYVFIRAINTGGRRLSNDEQIAPLVHAGLDATAYQAAGNLFVRGNDIPDEAALDDLLAAAYGFEVVTFVRTPAEVAAAIERQPFSPEQLSTTAGRVQVTFLRAEPTADDIAAVDEIVPDEDLVVFNEREWYWLPIEGVSTSSLPIPTIERIVGPMTMRTLGTVERMRKKFG